VSAASGAWWLAGVIIGATITQGLNRHTANTQFYLVRSGAITLDTAGM
jgi:hypothetical protein